MSRHLTERLFILWRFDQIYKQSHKVETNQRRGVCYNDLKQSLLAASMTSTEHVENKDIEALDAQ